MIRRQFVKKWILLTIGLAAALYLLLLYTTSRKPEVTSTHQSNHHHGNIITTLFHWMGTMKHHPNHHNKPPLKSPTLVKQIFGKVFNGFRYNKSSPTKKTYEYKISPEDGVYMFGYYNKIAVDNSNMKTLIGKIPFHNQEPAEKDVMEIGWVSINGDQIFNKIAVTRAWNLQQGCMMEWIGKDKIIYNTRKDDNKHDFQAVVTSLDGLKTRKYDLPVYAWTEGKYLSISFTRLHNLRRGYGYTVPMTDPEKCPNTDGIWQVDMESGGKEMLFSYAEIRKYLLSTSGVVDPYTKANYDTVPDSNEYYWWVNHLMWSKDRTHFSFVARASTAPHTSSYQFSALMIAYTRTKTLWRVPGLRGSHPYFGTFLLNCEKKGAFRIEFQKSIQELPFSQGQVTGHCSLSPDEEWILTDTFSSPMRKLILEQTNGNRHVNLGAYYPRNEGPDYTRCDLHPRWSRDGSHVIFDSTHKRTRAVYAYPVDKVLKPNETHFQW